MPDFDKLHHHVKALNELLEDRQEGLATWNLMAGGHWKDIVDLWTDQEDDTGGITPERAKELEGAAVVYGVMVTKGQVGVTKGILMEVGPDCFDKKDTTALLIVDATVEDMPEYRRNFKTLLILDWKTIFEHKEDARAYAVSIHKRRIDAINEEIEEYD